MEDVRIYAESEDAQITYKKIRTEPFTNKYFKETHEIFTMALLIGKYILNNREPLKTRKDIIRIETLEKYDDIDILKTIAIEENNDVTILSDIKEIFKICEEYANSGIKELKKWTANEETFQNKLSENLINIYQKNEEIISKYK